MRIAWSNGMKIEGAVSSEVAEMLSKAKAFRLTQKTDFGVVERIGVVSDYLPRDMVAKEIRKVRSEMRAA
jgi:hypothetical protein